MKKLQIKKLQAASVLTRSHNVRECINDLINGRVARPVKRHSRGRFTHNYSVNGELQRVLTQVGLKFVVGNDAPRSGYIGTYIKLV